MPAERSITELTERLERGQISTPHVTDLARLLANIVALRDLQEVECNEVVHGSPVRVRLVSGRYYAILSYEHQATELQLVAFG